MNILVRKNGQMEMDLPAVFLMLLRKSWLIALAALAGAALSVGYNYKFVAPSYQTAIALYVSNTAEGTSAPAVTTSDLSASMMLMQTCATVVKEEETLEMALRLSGLEYSPEELMEMVQISGVENTKMMYVVVTANNPKEAALIADSIGEVTPGIMKTIEPAGSVRVLNRAKVPDKKFAPSYGKAALMGFAAGMIAAIILLIIKAVLDTGVKNSRQLTAIGLPVLAIMPEEPRKIKDNLIYSLPGNKDKRILFTEFPPVAENMFTAAEIADAFAQDGYRILLIDCNLRMSRMRRQLGLAKMPGVSDVLVGKMNVESVIQKFKKNVDVIEAGRISLNPDALLASQEMSEMLDAVSSGYDYILILSSAEKENPGVASLAGLVSGTVIVTSRKRTRTNDLQDYMCSLKSAGANILGTIFYKEKRNKEKENKEKGK